MNNQELSSPNRLPRISAPGRVQMEPNGHVGRVRHVTISQEGCISGEIPLTIVDPAADFDSFYGPARESVGRALAITLGDADLAIDAVDEALTRAYQRWGRVSRYDNPVGWVYRVALNHATSRLRRVKRHTAMRPDRVEHVEFGVADQDIANALAQLSVAHRSVVVCRLLLAWPEADTAAALRIRPGTVKSRLHRALQQLEQHLDHLRPEES